MQSNVNDVWLDCMNDAEFSISLDLVERCIRSSDRAPAMQDYLVKGGRQRTRLAVRGYACAFELRALRSHGRVSEGVPVLAIP
ncbi:hypothetical protein [Bradyrhizobium tropiciagri]|uniref:hypothetical protein n=1 Tax=Bradyrhizobium tropiciagri TaxID=312253 RepID=UPI00067E0851|nr:hypothetical protein [Bradyrhizobium tropiciagri]